MTDKTKTQEIRSLQNLELRKWMLRALILSVVACVLVTIMSTASELGLSGKGSVNLGFANIELNSGESQKINPTQQQQLEQKAQQPQAQAFNTNNSAGFCPYVYGSYSFTLYPNVPYGPSYQGYYVSTGGNGQFGILNSYGVFTAVGAQTSGTWQLAAGSDISVCADSNGNYARFEGY